MLHAMHDAGKLSEKSLEEMFYKIFSTFPKKDLEGHFKGQEKLDRSIQSITYMLKEKRQEMVKNVILKMADKFLTES